MSRDPVDAGSVGVGPVGPAGSGPDAGSCEGSGSRVEEKEEVLDLGRNITPSLDCCFHAALPGSRRGDLGSGSWNGGVDCGPPYTGVCTCLPFW